MLSHIKSQSQIYLFLVQKIRVAFHFRGKFSHDLIFFLREESDSPGWPPSPVLLCSSYGDRVGRKKTGGGSDQSHSHWTGLYWKDHSFGVRENLHRNFMSSTYEGLVSLPLKVGKMAPPKRY